METAFSGHDLEGELLDLQDADDIAFIRNSSETYEAELDRLELSVSSFWICFAPSECKAYLQYW